MAAAAWPDTVAGRFLAGWCAIVGGSRQADAMRLVALDLPGGPTFVDALRAVWDAGDAALPLPQRVPAAVTAELLARLGADARVGPDGETPLERAADSHLRDGDALAVATSGATGAPKGVVLTHEAVRASALATSAALDVTDDDHWLACLPLNHVGGLSVITRALITGTSLTVLDRFDAAAVDATPATLTSLVTATLGRVDTTRFRRILLGGAAAPVDRPPNTVATYGMTETGSGVVYDGRPLDGVDVRIDPDGEIHLRGQMLLRSYHDGTSPLDAEGWLATDDLGRWLPDGRLHVEGRRGDLVITGGENVWPEPVERVLRRQPSVADAAIVGVPDAEWGQRLVAVVVAADAADPPTLDELGAAVRAELASYCAPRQLRLVGALPRTALGKLQRHLLAESPPNAGNRTTAD